jgi:hypothetical protein
VAACIAHVAARQRRDLCELVVAPSARRSAFGVGVGVAWRPGTRGVAPQTLVAAATTAPPLPAPRSLCDSARCAQVPPTATVDQISAVFQQYGSILDITTMPPRKPGSMGARADPAPSEMTARLVGAVLAYHAADSMMWAPWVELRRLQGALCASCTPIAPTAR